MPEVEANGTRLYYELEGDGEPVALVHGSWTDATTWALVAPALSQSFRLLTYDRRGHSRSERPDTQGSVHEDGDDLAALLEALELAPAHVVTNSFGGNIALRLAARRAELFRSLSCHEPPLWGLLEGDAESQDMLQQGAASIGGVAELLAAGRNEEAAHKFVDEVAFGPGAWDNALPPEAKEIMVNNAPTFLDEVQDPDSLAVDEEAFRNVAVPVRLTLGTESPPIFGRVIDRLMGQIPGAQVERIQGAAHVPQMTTPERYVEVTKRALLGTASA